MYFLRISRWPFFFMNSSRYRGWDVHKLKVWEVSTSSTLYIQRFTKLFTFPLSLSSYLSRFLTLKTRLIQLISHSSLLSFMVVFSDSRVLRLWKRDRFESFLTLSLLSLGRPLEESRFESQKTRQRQIGWVILHSLAIHHWLTSSLARIIKDREDSRW